MEQKLMAADGIRGFMCSFRGNPSAYAIQHFKKGKQSYETVRSPLTEADIQAHLRGERTLGVYPLDGDMVHFATIDIDIETESLRADAQRYVRSIKDYAKELGTLLLVEDTGNRGYHLHALFDAPVPAKIARQLLRVLTIEVAVPPQDGVGVEIFPKQDVAEDLGNPIKLPCGVHKKTGIRSTIVNRDFKPVEQPIRTILKWPRIQVATLREILKTHPALGLHERHNCDETIASGYDEHGDPGQAVYQCEFSPPSSTTHTRFTTSGLPHCQYLYRLVKPEQNGPTSCLKATTVTRMKRPRTKSRACALTVCPLGLVLRYVSNLPSAPMNAFSNP